MVGLIKCILMKTLKYLKSPMYWMSNSYEYMGKIFSINDSKHNGN